ncbi:hypothetical protein NUW58_g7142 [Xylaria curta]|uniref:Uncharacterized protein n=1 Tax=Xylaria curta TaxID=42375 RepID=A0ACC1NM63_9PEZI|nr:hypothetical protein NUW58_g7142 [Xylaria curta]
MRTVSFPKHKPTLQESQASMSDAPSPLHIIKRTKTMEFRPSTKRETSNGSIDYGPDRPLSVMKKRQRRGDEVNSSSSSRDRAREKQVANAESTFRFGGLVPKANWIPPAQRQQKSQAPLRWVSRQRTSSSGTTCHRYDLDCQSSSSDEPLIEQPSSFLDELSTSAPSECYSSAQMDISFSSMPMSADQVDDCHLLVPRISVTPEVQISENDIITVWAAIEVSVQLSHPCTNSSLNPSPGNNLRLSNPLRAGSVSRFGYLYDVHVDVLPVLHSTVIEVIRHDKKKRSLNLGSTMLVLAKVQIHSKHLGQSDPTPVHKSNELIADLERELGAISSKYLEVHLRYRHSGFPTSSNLTQINGTTACQTRLETTVTGVLDHQTLESPSGLSRRGISGSPLFDIVASHWGPLRANEIFFHKMLHQSNSTSAASTTPVNGHRTSMARDDLTYQNTAEYNPSMSLSQRWDVLQPLSQDQGEDPAHKIWTEMRRRISHSRPDIRAREAGNSSAGAGRELVRDAALLNKKSIGADSLKSLVPSIMNLDISSKEAWGSSSSSTDNKENVPPESRREGRWSLGAWW